MKNALTLITFLVAVLTANTQTIALSGEQTVALNYLDSNGNITDESEKEPLFPGLKKSTLYIDWMFILIGDH